MNFKTTYILFGLLLVMAGVLAVVLWQGPTAPAGEKHVFPSMHSKATPLPPEKIDKVVIQRKRPAESDLVFERVGERNWKITSPRSVPADSGNISQLVQAIYNARIDEENKPANAKAAGLDTPSRIIKLSGDDRELTLTLGDTTPGEEMGLVYVQSSDRKNQPLAVKKRDLEAALEGLNYFRGKNLLVEDTSDVRSIKLVHPKKGTVELKRDKDRWRLVQPPYGDADIGTLLTNLSDLRVSHTSEKDSDFVKDGVTNLAEYNLDPAKNEVLRIEVTRGEEKKPTTAAVLIGIGKKVNNDKSYYAAIDDGGKTKDIVRVAVANVEPILKVLDDPGAMRNKALVNLDSFKTPDAIDVKNSYGLLEFRKPDPAKPWQLYRDGTAHSVDDGEVRLLVDALNKKDYNVLFPDPKRKKELGLEKPDVVVKVWADSLEKPDEKKKGPPAFKKDAKPAAELRFGNKEGDNVAVERVWGNDTTIMLVPASLLDQVRKGPLAYYEKNIPSFTTGAADEDVTKLELHRPGESFEIERQGSTGGQWKFVKPDKLKGRQASDAVVREILGEMNRLIAREVVAEKAKPDELAKTYDLAKPPFRVVITQTKDKKPTTHEFLFGKELPGKGVYLKLGSKDTIYLVGPEVLTALRKELRDTTVFTFEPDKVVGLALKGWANVLGTPFTLSLERKEGKWTVQSPKDFKLDEAKVGQLVSGLSNLQAEKFVPTGKELKLEQGALQIEITLPEKKVLSLTVGGLEGTSYFATSNQVEGSVFTVNKDLFEEAKKAPAYFRAK